MARRRSTTALFILTAPIALLITGWFPLGAQTALDWDEATVRFVSALPSVPVATDATWPPMEFFNRDGILVGFDIDLMREIGRRAGFQPRFVPVAWDGIFTGLMNAHYDVIASSVTILEERKRVMLFSDPYLDAAQYLVVPDSEEGRTVTDLGDMQGLDVGAQIGTTGARIAGDAGARVRTYDDLGLAIEDLVQGRLAGVVADVAIVEFYVLSHPHYGDRLRVIDTPYATEQYGFAVRRELETLRDDINAALREMRRDGSLERIKRFWFTHIIPAAPAM